MFLDVCNTGFLTKKCPQSCIQNYWQMFMIFCLILVAHINSCLRLKFFSSFSSSLTSPYLPHLSSPSPLLTSPSPWFRLPHSLTLHLPSSPLPLPPSLSLPSLTSPSSASLTFPSPSHPHLSLFIFPSPSLSIPPSRSLTSPSPPLRQLSSFFYIDRLCQPCVCGGGRTCMWCYLFVCRMPLCMWLYDSLIDW